MRGDLGETRLEAIFGELAGSGGTGALHLEGDVGPAKVFFRDGDVYYASSPAPRAQLGARLVGAGFIDEDDLDRALAAQEQGPTRTKLGAILVDQGMVRRDVIRVFVQEQILDAVFDLARWDAGTFEFFRGDAVAEDLPVQIPTGPLLMEVRRRLSEWDDIRTVIPSLDAVPDFVRGGSTTQAALEPDEFTLLTSVDGRRSVRDLAQDLGYSQFDAARLIYGLSLLGVIALTNGEARTAPGPPGAEERPTDTDEPEEVDIGRALEEALFGAPYDESGTHVAEPTSEPDDEPGYEHVEEPAEDLEAVAEEVADEVAREAARTTEDPAPRRSDLTAGADDLEPEIWSASIDVDEEAAERADDARPREPATPSPPSATSPDAPDGAERAVPDDAPDQAADARDELMALVDELQDESSEEEPDQEAVPRPEPEPSTRPEAPPEQREPGADEPAGRTERGDVSELLRELSRLAGGGTEPVAPTPDDRAASDAAPGSDGPDDEQDDRQEPAEPPPRSGDDDDDDDKRSAFRRLFGSR